MAFCASCGTQLLDGAAFCPKCGNAQAASAGAQASNPGAVVTPTAVPVVSNPGMTNNVAGALAYFLTFLTGILFLIIEPYNKDRFVRFHAFQAIFFGVAVFGLSIIFSILTGMMILGGGGFFVLIWRLTQLLQLAFFLCWLFLMYKAYNKEEFKLPIIGDLAAKQAGK